MVGSLHFERLTGGQLSTTEDFKCLLCRPERESDAPRTVSVKLKDILQFDFDHLTVRYTHERRVRAFHEDGDLRNVNGGILDFRCPHRAWTFRKDRFGFGIRCPGSAFKNNFPRQRSKPQYPCFSEEIPAENILPGIMRFEGANAIS